MEDTRRLIPMSIKHLDGDKWLISIDGGESYSVEGDIDSIKKVCRRIKAKDGENKDKCRSAKVGTYLSMISDNDNEEHKINVWKSKIPHSAEEFCKLMEKKTMKLITLTKPYLVEGNIIPKGTLMRITEGKIEFLPTEIWDKAKEISDEHERFEFVKAELNKLGDDYTDDDIEDFLNKYKSNLNESKARRFTEETVEEMIDMLDETIRSEDYVDEKYYDKVLEIAKKDKNLLNAWDVLCNADTKSFNKKENAFWKIFDNLCKPYKKKDKDKDEENK